MGTVGGVSRQLRLGGGNFLLSVLDHAQNGFFNPLEWLPVGTSAFAIGALLMVVVKPQQRHTFCFIVLGVNALLGLAGFVLHLNADLQQPAPLVEKFLYGAPLFAPLLFVDLALLAAIGLWQLRRVSTASKTTILMISLEKNKKACQQKKNDSILLMP